MNNTYGHLKEQEETLEQLHIERRLSLQYAVTRALADSGTLSEAIPKVLQAICIVGAWDLAEFWLLNDAQDTLTCHGFWCNPKISSRDYAAGLARMSLGFGQGIVGKVWAGARPIWTSAIADDTEDNPRAALTAAMGMHTALGYPVREQNKFLGVIVIATHEQRHPDAHTLEMFSTLGSQMGTFLVRKRAEEALHRNEQRFRALIENSHDLITLTDPRGTILYATPSVSRILGYQPQVLAGKSLREYIHPDDRQHVINITNALIQHPEGTIAVEYRMRHHDGTWRWMETVYSNFLSDSAIEAIVSNSRDITERRRAREVRSTLAAIVESSDDAIMSESLDGIITSWNRGAETAYGYTAGEVLGKSASVIVPPERSDEIVVMLERIAHGQTIRHFETERLHKDGHRIDVSISLSPLQDGTGSIVGASSIARDITDRKKAESTLRRHASELQKQAELLDRAHVLVKGLDNRIVFWNTGSMELYGWTKEEVIGRPSDELFQTVYPKSEQAIHEQLLRDGSWQGELLHTTRSGRQLVIASHWVLYRDEHGNPSEILETNNDITDLKRAEREIRRLNEELEMRVRQRTAQLEEANRELETFSYSVSHDLRSPLRAIDGFSRELLEHHLGSLDVEAARYLEVIRTKTSMMGQLIDDLLEFSRVSRVGIDMSTIDMNLMVQTILDEMRRVEPSSLFETKVGPLPGVRGNPAMIRQVWANLIGNAVKFSRKKDRPLVEIWSDAGPHEITFSVKDNGIGFPMERADKLFGVFQRLHRQEDFEGTGVGLAIVQRIIHRHGGTVWGESKINEGATFHFTLPTEVNNA